jgi:hypothetical protein
VPLARSVSFSVLSFHHPPGSECISLARFLTVSRLSPTLQEVSVPGSPGFLWCPELSLPLNSVARECFAHTDSFRVLICLSFSLSALQYVSALHVFGLFPCPDLSLPLCFPESNDPLLAQFLTVF